MKLGFVRFKSNQMPEQKSFDLWAEKYDESVNYSIAVFRIWGA